MLSGRKPPGEEPPACNGSLQPLPPRLRLFWNSSNRTKSPFLCPPPPSSPHRWLKFEEDVEDGGERWSKPYVATLSLHSLFELRSCIINGSVLLDMRASCIEEIAGDPCC